MDGVGFRPSSELTLIPKLMYFSMVKLNSIQERKLKPRKITIKEERYELNQSLDTYFTTKD